MAALCSLALSQTALAGEFVQDEGGIWYRNEDGSWKTGWFLDADGSWYYFDQEVLFPPGHRADDCGPDHHPGRNCIHV